MENFEKLMTLIREDHQASWISQQLDDTFTQGVSMSVKDSKIDSEFFRLEPPDISTREKSKREKYETSRPYTNQEKYGLVIKALERVFLELPAIQYAAVHNLSELCEGVESIEYVSAEGSYDRAEEISQGSHIIDLMHAKQSREILVSKYNSFIEELTS